MVSVGILGLGAMGSNHARALAGMNEVNATFAYDSDPLVTTPKFVERLSSLEALLDIRPDYCVLATPSSSHYDGVEMLTNAGIPFILEKPVAGSLREARKIEKHILQSSTCIVRVGHVERFNPAIIELWHRIRSGEIGELQAISTTRRGPLPSRYVDTGVTLDLGVHDFDLTRWIASSDYEWISAGSRMRPDGESEGLIRVVAQLESGIVVDHAIDWLTPQKQRQLSVLGSGGMFVADLLTADLTYFSRGDQPMDWPNLEVLRGGSEGAVTRYAIPKVEPLRAEHLAFTQILRGGDLGNMATVADGIRAMEIAQEVTDIAAGQRRR